MRLRVGLQHSRFLSILARFMDYYSLFCGPKAISMVVEPKGVLTCWSSTLTILANSGSFRGLLLTVLGSRSDSHDYRTQGCVYVSVINTRRLGRFWPVSLTITQFWGLKVISTIDEPQDVLTCRSSTLTVLANSGLFRGLLRTVLGSRC